MVKKSSKALSYRDTHRTVPDKLKIPPPKK
jgi:hypothetical protein